MAGGYGLCGVAGVLRVRQLGHAARASLLADKKASIGLYGLLLSAEMPVGCLADKLPIGILLGDVSVTELPKIAA